MSRAAVPAACPQRSPAAPQARSPAERIETQRGHRAAFIWAAMGLSICLVAFWIYLGFSLLISFFLSFSFIIIFF